MARMILKKQNILLLLFCLQLTTPLAVKGQPSTGIGLGDAWLQPVGSLQNWFKSSLNAPRLDFMFNGTQSSYWSLFATAVHFKQPNTDKLFYKDLSLDLKLYGLGVSYVSIWAKPFRHLQGIWQGEIMLYRWQALRGAYQLEDRQVPERFQQAWSFAGAWGPGLLVHFSAHFEAKLTVKYQLVVAELWPALALHLENVSGLQMVKLGLTFQWWF